MLSRDSGFRSVGVGAAGAALSWGGARGKASQPAPSTTPTAGAPDLLLGAVASSGSAATVGGAAAAALSGAVAARAFPPRSTLRARAEGAAVPSGCACPRA